ncbi:MAG: single-stranded-DNA-specific exonuclease RecJ [Bacillota bacterium]|nr:single-stranded-DNA-specific exonuclease RecJ [Bacillota bacterium]
MSLAGKRWILRTDFEQESAFLSKELNISPVLARLLLNRGIDSPEKARAFLQPTMEHFHSPWQMQGMEETVARLLKALEKGEKIIVHGDYDADGISASVILVQMLRSLGGNVEYYLPSRFNEGYGLHSDPLKSFQEKGVSLVITVDCGISAVEEADYAHSLDLDLIITDHHEPIGSLPGALAVINPKQKSCPYPFKELSGAGIAFKIASALVEKAGQALPVDLLDLAALGTAADVVPLIDENRLIVSSGLEILRQKNRIGFQALAEVVNFDLKNVSATTLSFILAPSINAVGRMGEAGPAAELLLTGDQKRAMILAEELHGANKQRRDVERQILEEAEKAALEGPLADDEKIIVLAGTGWHHGVIGIVASRLVEKYNRPVVLIALDGNEGRGSARSINGFDITEALAGSASFLERFGGHEQAAGFSVTADNIKKVQDDLYCYARTRINDEQLKPKLYLEAELSGDDIDFSLVDRLKQFQPFGTGNPAPLFVSPNWELKSWRIVGKDKKHLKIKVSQNGLTLDPIFFSGAYLEPLLQKHRKVDLAVKIKEGFFRQEKTIDMEARDLRYCDSEDFETMEIVDLRGIKNRMHFLKELVQNKEGETAIFVSTKARMKEIEKFCSCCKKLYYFTSGSNNKSGSIFSNFNSVVLYDLPLFGDPLHPLFGGDQSGKRTAVYLLFNEKDRQRNSALIDYSLPAPEILKKIAFSVSASGDSDLPKKMADLIKKNLGFKPATGYLSRVEAILGEIGLLQEHFSEETREEILNSWPDCLKKSPAWQEVAGIRENCEQFQCLYLEGSRKEIAASLKTLAEG